MEASPLEKSTDCVFLQLQSLAEIKWINGGCVFARECWYVCVFLYKISIFFVSVQTTWNIQSFNETS